ncbi:MAG TPA: aminoglycoside adenylyltransferase domain-containing protein [Opitutaceae bacterium]
MNEILREFSARLPSALGSEPVGVYLHGSLAVGDFDEASSDIDFIVVTDTEPTSAQVAGVRQMHTDLLSLPSPYSKRLEGSYFPRALLSGGEKVGVDPLWFFDGGTRTLGQSICDNSWVVLWELHNCGVAVVGPEPKSFFGPVPVATLQRAVLSEMKAWTERLASNPSSLNNPWNRSFVVLTHCRMLETLESGAVHSKAASVRWSEAALPLRWSPLINRALLGRKSVDGQVVRPDDEIEVTETLAFVEYAMARGCGSIQEKTT